MGVPIWRGHSHVEAGLHAELLVVAAAAAAATEAATVVTKPSN